LIVLVLDPLGLSIKVAGASTPNDWVRVVGWGLPAAMFLIAAVFFERGRAIDRKSLPLLVTLGDCSYSLYLMHPFALLVIGKAWVSLHFARVLPWEALGLCLFAGSLGMALLTYRVIEKPVTKWLHRRAERLQRAASSA
jgi:peptidoglycan/LPS O-acetylase OafA/YrhL